MILPPYQDIPIKPRVSETCGKVAYTSQREAQRVLNTVRTKVWSKGIERKRRGKDDKLPKRAYKCECGMWHLTSHHEHPNDEVILHRRKH